MQKRPNFYPDGTFIPYQMPNDFRQSQGKEACGNCGLYSNRRSFCGKFITVGVKDNYICNQWRQRYFKR
jgi:hypothetical protein